MGRQVDMHKDTHPHRHSHANIYGCTHAFTHSIFTYTYNTDIADVPFQTIHIPHRKLYQEHNEAHHMFSDCLRTRKHRRARPAWPAGILDVGCAAKKLWLDLHFEYLWIQTGLSSLSSILLALWDYGTALFRVSVLFEVPQVEQVSCVACGNTGCGLCGVKVGDVVHCRSGWEKGKMVRLTWVHWYHMVEPYPLLWFGSL